MNKTIQDRIQLNLKSRLAKEESNDVQRKSNAFAERFEAVFQWLEKIPFKAMSALATTIGACIVVAYYVHIEYQPTLDAVNFPMLLGQVFYAGLLVCFGFFCLFFNVLIASMPSLGSKAEVANQSGPGKGINFILLFLAHFPVILFSVARANHDDRIFALTSAWWIFLLWFMAFFGFFIWRVRLLQRRNKNEKQAGELNVVLEVQGTTHLANDKNTSDVRSPETQAREAKPPSSLDLLIGDLMIYIAVAGVSGIPWLILVHILDVAPVSAHVNEYVFWGLWTMLAFMNAVFSLDTNISVGLKFTMAVGLIAVILAMGRLTYLPFTLAIRLSGIGQIAHVDLELSQPRCLIVRRQLQAAGLNHRLTCDDEKSDEDQTPKEAQESKVPIAQTRVLKDAMLLNRVGTEFYVEIKLPRSSQLDEKKEELYAEKFNESNKAPERTRTKENEGVKNASIETEPVVRFRIPKGEANEIIYAEVPITSRALLGPG